MNWRKKEEEENIKHLPAEMFLVQALFFSSSAISTIIIVRFARLHIHTHTPIMIKWKYMKDFFFCFRAQFFIYLCIKIKTIYFIYTRYTRARQYCWYWSTAWAIFVGSIVCYAVFFIHSLSFSQSCFVCCFLFAYNLFCMNLLSIKVTAIDLFSW